MDAWLELGRRAEARKLAASEGRPRDTEEFLRQFWELEDRLVAAGLPAMPQQWWRPTIERFYRSGKRRLVIRKGRRVFASTCVAPRLAVAEMLYGKHKHFKGTPPLAYVFLSVKKSEATQRLLGIKAVLGVLGEDYTQPSTETIQLTSRPATFQVLAASHRTTVGGTVAFAWCDEVSRWYSGETSANPAREIIGALSPALATLPNAKLLLVSSPLTNDDYHARQFNLGDTPEQSVAVGATWEINPTLTEQATRELEPDEATWLREYGAVPSDGVVNNWFGSVALSKAITDELPPKIYEAKYWIAIDAAFAHDLFGWCVVASHRDRETSKRVTWVHACGAWEPDEPSVMAQRLKEEVCSPYNTTRIYGDQHEARSFSEIARGFGLSIITLPWTATEKLLRYKLVRTAMLDGTFRVPNDPELVRELRSVCGVFSDTGNERPEVKRDTRIVGHGDRVSALVLAGSQALMRSPSDDVDPPIELKIGTVEWYNAEQKRMRDDAVRKVKERQRKAEMQQLRRIAQR